MIMELKLIIKLLESIEEQNDKENKETLTNIDNRLTDIEIAIQDIQYMIENKKELPF